MMDLADNICYDDNSKVDFRKNASPEIKSMAELCTNYGRHSNINPPQVI